MKLSPGAKAVNRANLPEKLAQQLLDLIAANDLKAGDRLPTVQELATYFAVGAPTVREALKRLELTGTVDVRHGSGTYVSRSAGRVVIGNPYADRYQPGTLRELLEARLLIEPALAERAALRATEEELAAIEALLAEARAHLGGAPEDDALLNETNIRIHLQIAAAAGNAVLCQVLESIVETHHSDQMTLLALYDDRARDHREHQAIVRAMRARQPATARRRMARHLEGVRDVVDGRADKEAGGKEAREAEDEGSLDNGSLDKESLDKESPARGSRANKPGGRKPRRQGRT